MEMASFADIYRGEDSLSYLLKGDTSFSLTSYRVMQGQEASGFLRCIRVIYNGSDKLVYITIGLTPLEQLLPELSSEDMFKIFAGIVDALISLKGTGFLYGSNVELQIDKIFVLRSELKVKLVYLPVDIPAGKAPNSKQALSTLIEKIARFYPHLRSPGLQSLQSALEDPLMTFEQVRERLSSVPGSPWGEFERVTGEITEDVSVRREPEAQRGAGRNFFKNLFSGRKKEPAPEPVETVAAVEEPDDIFVPGLLLEGVDGPLEILVNKKEFVMGKKEDSVDGVVACSNAVSRVHCKITYSSGNSYIQDLGSANGTYVSSKRLQLEQKVQIHPGDRIKLADINFIVREI